MPCKAATLQNETEFEYSFYKANACVWSQILDYFSSISFFLNLQSLIWESADPYSVKQASIIRMTKSSLIVARRNII